MSEPIQQEPTTPPKRPLSSRSPVCPGTQHTKPQEIALPLPAPDDRQAWKQHWEALGQSWRTEPEIDAERQHDLAERRAMTPDIAKGVYPFGGIPLTRAEIEWLLATHEGGRGPVDWKDASQRKRQGLDLRGADLRGVDLRHLPLTGLCAGLTREQRAGATHEQRHLAAIHLEKATLFQTHLERSLLGRAHLEGANLEAAFLQQTDLSGANLTGAYLRKARLQSATLYGTQLEGALFTEADLRGVTLHKAWMDGRTQLVDAQLDEQILVADIVWNSVPLTPVRWDSVPTLGEEQQARRVTDSHGKKKGKAVRLLEYQVAVRAYRQLAVVLRGQGLHEEADRFAYRAHLLQQEVLRRQRKFLKYLGSWLLWLIAGYGYRPLRPLLIYLTMIGGFATVSFFLGPQVGTPLSPLGALVFSITSFHGRGFFPGGSPGHSITLDDPLTVVAAAEAVVGLLLEISFIATFTQRFFSR